jgi:ABC-type dipeptide/oligopeptide/nickel transport system permease subunit
MKKRFNVLKFILVFILILPLLISWIPSHCFEKITPEILKEGNYIDLLFASFKELSLTLITTLIFAMFISILLGYLSVLSMKVGRFFSNIMNGIESVPSILIALFCYAPVSGVLARSKGNASEWVSLMVFVLAATATTLPEAVRSITIPLSDLYNRKYSVSFRSYGFPKRRILSVLMKTDLMLDTIKRVAAGILLKTLVLDTSFGFVIQVGFGTYGTPAHLSPGALIAANRGILLGFATEGNPLFFWLPSLFLITISVAFLIILNDNKEVA